MANPEPENLHRDSYVPVAGAEEVTLGEGENAKPFRFCWHCHTYKPSAQIPVEGKNAGICVNCVNGRNNYDRLAKAGLIPYRAGFEPAPVEPKQPRARKSKTTTAEDGTQTTPDGTVLGVDVTTGEPVPTNA